MNKSYRETYQEGLLDVCQFLVVEMKEFLVKEDRFKFRVERFWAIIRNNVNQMNRNVTEDDIDNYGRTLYLVRKAIYSEYKYLRLKRMSPADCTITILHKILDYSENLGEFRFSQEQRKIKEVIDTLWENIRHQAKTSTLKYLRDRMILSLENELRGTLCLHELSLNGIENPKPKEQKLHEETKFYKDSPKTKEINL